MIDWTDVNGVSLRYDLSGDGPATLVLLHEMGGSLESWDYVLPLLPPCRILRFDMRGCGFSQKINKLTFDDLLLDLSALMDFLKLNGPVSMAGIAVGAALGVRFAAQNPDRVKRLVLMSLACGIAPEQREPTRALAAQIAAGGLRDRVDLRLPATFADEFRDDPIRLRAFRGRAMANDPASYAAWYHMLLDLDLTADLSQLRCPALVLAGQKDGTRPPARVARDAATIPDHIFEAVSSGHVMPMLTPGLVADRLKGFAL
jgi:3-oxoadipate enol-lactonase